MHNTVVAFNRAHGVHGRVLSVTLTANIIFSYELTANDVCTFPVGEKEKNGE